MSEPHLLDEELLEPSSEQQEHLATCRGCASRRNAQFAVRSALVALPRAAEISPATAALLEAHRRNALSGRRTKRLAIAVLFVPCLLVASLVWRRAPLPASLTEELALDHLHYHRKLEDAVVRGDLRLSEAYFLKNLGFRPHYGAMEATRFEGAKPCRIGGKWTALAWFDRAGHWMSLFTMPEHAASGRGCSTTEGVRVCAAPDPRGGARVLVSDLSENEMLRLIDESLR